MIEFIQNYWQFLTAGLIVLALAVYWIIEIILAKKAKVKDFEELENLVNAPAEQTAEEPKQVEVQEDVKQEEQPKEQPAPEPAPKQAVEVAEEVASEPKAKASKSNYVISYDKNEKEWIVKKEGSQRASKRTKTKEEAMNAVKKLSASNDVGFVVKKKDGKFQKK